MVKKKHFQNVIKDRIILNEHSVNVTGRMFIHNREPSQVLRMFPVNWVIQPCKYY